MPFTLDDVSHVPAEPGVYLMKDAEGAIFYVGKAASLRARLRQYLGQSSDTRYFVGLLDRLLDDVEVILTRTEKEALILENELIKRYQPRFNVELKDDKSFLHLRIDERQAWPRIEVVRRPKRDRARYFGPYHSASKIRETLRLVERHFQLRSCEDATFRNRMRPCLQHQIGRCPAPCVLPVPPEAYAASVHDVITFLLGRRVELVDRLRASMRQAAEGLDFERAARLRDQVQAVEGSLEQQEVVGAAAIDRDVVGFHREGGLMDVAVLLVRRGRMTGSRTFSFRRQAVPDAEVLSTFLNLFYSGGHDVPREVLLPLALEGAGALRERLRELRGRAVSLRWPARGAGRRLLDMARRNAEHAFLQARRSEAVRDGALARLKRRLRLQNLPLRIECYDISIFQGASPVGSRVVFEGGVPLRSGYRHYKIRSVAGSDDYAMMREVLQRRLSRGLEEGDLPDLIVVDGGKGQLNVAQAAIGDLGIEGVDVVGLAKSRVLDEPPDDRTAPRRSPERVFLPGVRDPVALRPHTDELFLLTRLRDEAHRFAITFHRKQRRGATLGSALDDVPGIGAARRRALLRAFGSLKRLRAATPAEIVARVPGVGPALAAAVHAGLR